MRFGIFYKHQLPRPWTESSEHQFMRIVSGVSPPLAVMLEGRATVEGDLGVVARLGEMFGGPSPW